MLDFEENYWFNVSLIIGTLLMLIYAVYMSVKDIKWEDRNLFQKIITVLTFVFMIIVFYFKLSKK
jgi:Na+(H+)/acetate symporter ActP